MKNKMNCILVSTVDGSKGRILIRDKIELEGRGTGGEREEVRGGGTHSSACMCAIILAI